MDTATRKLAGIVVEALRATGVNFVSYLPETRLSEMIPLLREDNSFMLLPVASEADAVSIAAGAALGGKRAAVYMEGTGAFVSTYSLLTVAERFNIPLLLLISYIGSSEDKRNSLAFSHYGTKLIPLLNALGFEYLIVRTGQEVAARIEDAVRSMNSLKLPVALLFTGDFTV